jgi:RNA polymerase sigma factor (sigma-70 family)
MRPEDAQLVAHYLEGDADAHATVEGWLASASRPFRRRLGPRWEDVAQDIRLEITRLLGQGTFRGESSLKTYLWRVACHTCLDRLRAQSRWLWTEIDALPEWEADAILTDPAPALEQEAKDLLMRVVEQVPEECRKMWAMVLEGLSYREMSQRVGVSEGALRVRVLRCRKRALELRRELLAAG